MKKIVSILALSLSFTSVSFAQNPVNNCSTLEGAKAGILAQAQAGVYPFSSHGTYTLAYFAKLESVKESDYPYCHFNGEDCDESEAEFAMPYSFEPGARGWIGISKSCEIVYEISFRD